MKATTLRLLTALLVLDAAILQGMAPLQRGWATRLMRAFTHLGDAPSWVFVGAVLLVAGGEGPKQAALLWTGATLATVASQILKRIWRRPRPSKGIEGFRALVENPDAFSFPSGHTSEAFAVAVALAGQGTALAAVAFPLATGIAVSRVHLGAHYPLDVGVGLLLGAAAGTLTRILVLG